MPIRDTAAMHSKSIGTADTSLLRRGLALSGTAIMCSSTAPAVGIASETRRSLLWCVRHVVPHDRERRN